MEFRVGQLIKVRSSFRGSTRVIGKLGTITVFNPTSTFAIRVSMPHLHHDFPLHEHEVENPTELEKVEFYLDGNKV
jgi:hypothetical protein